jgi:hypothetical protein
MGQLFIHAGHLLWPDNRRAAKNDILTMTTVFSLFHTTLTYDSLLVNISALEHAAPN